ncbi:MAG: nucleotidyltransferase domain-containing protein [Bryobacteraceae bacterium]
MGAVFTPEDRERIREILLARAARDARISGAAITGSAALGRQDRWSDIDLAFGVDGQVDPVLTDWTAHMAEAHGSLHHVDVIAGEWTYRVFLLPGTLQVDLAFAPAAEFGSLAPGFRLVSGRARGERTMPGPAPAHLIGFGWLYAIHARTAIARGEAWQAEYMISGVRDHAMALACLRHGLPAMHGRGLDRLPNELRSSFEAALVRSLDTAELSRAFESAVDRLSAAIRLADPDLSVRLEPELQTMTRTAR